MARSRPGRRCGAWRLLPPADPIALGPPRPGRPASAQALSTPRCRQKPPPLAASDLVVDAIVVGGGALGFAVPDGNRSGSLGLEHDLADCITDQLRDAAPGARGGPAQGIKLFLAEVNLGFSHVCHFDTAIDVRQALD